MASDLSFAPQMTTDKRARAAVVYESVVCLPQVIVELVSGYDFRPHHQFVSSPHAILNADRREFAVEPGFLTSVRGERSFANAALKWSFRISPATDAWIGIVRLDATPVVYLDSRDDFLSSDIMYVFNNDLHKTVFSARSDTDPGINFYALPAHDTNSVSVTEEKSSDHSSVCSVWTFEVDLTQRCVYAECNGGQRRMVFSNVADLHEMTVCATLDRRGIGRRSETAGFVLLECK